MVVPQPNLILIMNMYIWNNNANLKKAGAGGTGKERDRK